MFALLNMSLNADAKTLVIQSAYLGKQGNVHVITKSGSDIQLTKKGHNDQVKLSENKKAVGWISKRIKDESRLVLYYEGNIRTFRGGPFVRDFWFVNDGEKIAVDIGGLHFAGMEILYDVTTGERLDEVRQWEVPYDKRPQWSKQYR